MSASPDIPAETPGDEPADSSAAAKKAHRDIGRATRCALDPQACRAAADALAGVLQALPELADARVVLAYAATAEEISLLPTVLRLRKRGAKIAYPRVEEPGVLAMHLIADESDLVPGPFGIREPAVYAPRPDSAAIDAVLVPGIAFDEHGVRVGFGGGFYDRLLPLIPQAVRIGVSYDEQIAGPLPLESHDVLMDLVVTPERTLRMGPRRSESGEGATHGRP